MNATEPIPFSGTLTVEEYSRAYREMVRPTFRLLLPLFGIMGIGFFLVPLALILLSGRSPAFGTTFLPMIVVVIIAGILWYFYQFGGRQAYHTLPLSVRAPASGHVSSSELVWNTDVANTTFRWAAFTHYVERGDILLLYQGMAATVLPRSFFADEAAWQQARAIVQGQLSTTKKGN